jgi:anthranilate phosphoribosyltransferase
MSFAEYIDLLKGHKNLDRTQAREFLGYVLDDGQVTDEQIAEALTALTKQGATVDEIQGFIDAMRERMTPLPYKGDAIDTCGTGGDKSGTFNISTAAAIVLAGGGVTVAKHGNRAATSKCGSADVLEALGIPTDLPSEKALQELTGHGFVFLFAPLYHPALKRLAIVRKSLGFPTVFNLLGPLLNPAGVRRQVLGTFSQKNAELLAEVMSRMDYEHALVLTSDDGLDEASLAAPVNIFEIRRSKVTKSRIMATDFGLEAAPVSDLAGGDSTTNAKIIKSALQPAKNLSTHQRVIALNAGLGFYVSGKAPTIEAGVRMATDVLQDGRAAAKLQELTNG